MLAAWKAAGITVSINPMYRTREVTHILRDSGAASCARHHPPPQKLEGRRSLAPQARPDEVHLRANAGRELRRWEA
jgi:acyl-CoA synthetase (AMP-forming)/AMP-acid ligase II